MEIKTRQVPKGMTALELKQLRLALGWSQKRLALELGVDVMTVSRWERGVFPIPGLVGRFLNLYVEDGA